MVQVSELRIKCWSSWIKVWDVGCRVWDSGKDGSELRRARTTDTSFLGGGGQPRCADCQLEILSVLQVVNAPNIGQHHIPRKDMQKSAGYGEFSGTEAGLSQEKGGA